MAQETNQTQVPLLCSNGCGFYGNPRNNGMCSVCYKDSLQRQKNTKSGRSIDSGESDVLFTLLLCIFIYVTQQSFLLILSSLCFSMLAVTHKDSASAAAQSGLKAPEVSCSKLVRNIQESTAGSSSAEESTVRGKRKLDETCPPIERVSVEYQDQIQSRPKKNRCFTCRKKVRLTGFGCRCRHLFCNQNYSFDYKADAAEKIRKKTRLSSGRKSRRFELKIAKMIFTLFTLKP
uniref:Zinc finger, AN1-type domain 6 n=1 Tax=Cyprinus carpio carpio TaxID=630221 RepID=A0A8C0YHQ4_CYPCA